jgi:CHASE2 domain-containing sensor protein
MENKSENKPLRGRKFMKLFENSTFVGVLLGVIAFAIYATLFHFNVLYSVELMTLKSRFDFSRSQPSDNCVVLAIDRNSIDELGRWPWPRDYHAQIIEALNFYGVRAIVFDLTFSALDLNNIEGDQKLIESLNKYKNVTLAGIIMNSYNPPSLETFYG